jgi:ATP-binding cassette, subfamily B, bacterial MsbA
MSFKQSLITKIGFNIPEQSLLFRLLAENIPEHKKKYFIAFVAMVLMASTTATMALMMGLIVDVMSDPARTSEIYIVSAVIFLIFVVKGFSSFVQITFLAKAGNRIVANKQIELFNHLIRQSANFLGNVSSSDLVMRVTQSAQMARSVIDTVVTGFLRDLLTLISLIIVMFYQQPFLSIVTLLVGPLIFIALRRILAMVHSIMSLELAGISEIIKAVQEASGGMRVVKAFGLEPHLMSRMEDAARGVERRANKIRSLEASTDPIVDTIAGVAISGVVLLGAVGLFGASAGTPGQLISFVTAFLLAYEPAKRLSRMRVSIEAGMVGVRMMYELLDKPVDLLEPEKPIAPPRAPVEIVFKDVSFGYDAEAMAIKGLSHRFEAGKVTALVGPSGGGKSTILNLFLRLHDPNAGSVRFNGIDIRALRFADLRKLTSFVGQDTFLFDTTIKENIQMVVENASDEEVRSAAIAANAHQFIVQYPDGYDTMIGENGRNLSGGQRQRLSIARAILKAAPILLLDEATSALDSHSERHVQEAIDLAAKGATTIVVAHRLSTILKADEICYVEDGKIVEHGSLDELLVLNGKFRELYDLQFKSSI